MSKERDNLTLIRQIHEAQSYQQAIAPALAGNVEWWAAGPSDLLPWAGTFCGPEGKDEWSRRLNSLMAYDTFETLEYIAEDDQVVTVIRASGHAIPTGKRFESEIVRIYTLRDERIVRVRSYYDTAAYVAALRV